MHGVTTIAEEIVDVCQKNEKACPRIGSHLPFNCILNSLGWLPWFGTEKTPNRKCHVNLHSDVNHYWITEELYPSNGKELLPILGVCIKLKKCKNQKKKKGPSAFSLEQRGEKIKEELRDFLIVGENFPRTRRCPLSQMTGANTNMLRAAADASSGLRAAYGALRGEDRRVACQPSSHPSEHTCQFPALLFLHPTQCLF